MKLENNPFQNSLLLFAFGLSGTTSLIFQILWNQKISIYFGVSAHAIATTLSAILLGMGIGAWFAEKLLQRTALSPLKLYASAECIVLITAILIEVFLTQFESFASVLAIYCPADNPLYLGLRFLVLVVVLVIPASAMGASFPFLVRAILNRSGKVVQAISSAYGINVLGAAIGSVLTAQILLMRFGIQQSVFITSCLCLISILIALRVDRSSSLMEQSVSVTIDKSPIDKTVLYVLVAWSGCSAMAFEIIWSRIYRQAFWLANPFQAFAHVLGIILCGMAVGSLILSRNRKDSGSNLRLFMVIQFSLSVLCLLGITQIRRELANLLSMGFGSVYQMITIAVICCGALLLGTSFPLLSSLHNRVNHKIGSLYAASSLGGVCGTIIGGFVLLPYLGIRGALIVLMMGFAISGTIAFQSITLNRLLWHRKFLIYIGGIVLIGVSLLSVTKDKLDFECPQCELLWLQDGLEATTAVVLRPDRGPILYTNGRSITPGALPRRSITPFLIAPKYDRVLSVGFGSGQLAKLLAENFPNSQIDCVELDGNMVQTTQFFGTEEIFTLSNFTLYVDDGRQHLLRNKGVYDVIYADTFTHSINTQIYGQGFFTDARRALTEDGSFFITVPLQDLPTVQEAEVILRTAYESFPYAYVIAPQGMLAIVGRNKPLAKEIRALPRALKNRLRFTLSPNDIYQIDTSVVEQFVSTRVNTDDHPYFFPLMKRSHPGNGEEMRLKIREWGEGGF